MWPFLSKPACLCSQWYVTFFVKPWIGLPPTLWWKGRWLTGALSKTVNRTESLNWLWAWTSVNLRWRKQRKPTNYMFGARGSLLQSTSPSQGQRKSSSIHHARGSLLQSTSPSRLLTKTLLPTIKKATKQSQVLARRLVNFHWREGSWTQPSKKSSRRRALKFRMCAHDPCEDGMPSASLWWLKLLFIFKCGALSLCLAVLRRPSATWIVENFRWHRHLLVHIYLIVLTDFQVWEFSLRLQYAQFQRISAFLMLLINKLCSLNCTDLWCEVFTQIQVFSQ